MIEDDVLFGRQVPLEGPNCRTLLRNRQLKGWDNDNSVSGAGSGYDHKINYLMAHGIAVNAYKWAG